MKLKQDKEWFERCIPEEQDFDITARLPTARFERNALLAGQQSPALTATSYILQLLNARQDTVARSYLEPALIFMFLDEVRKGTLDKKHSSSSNGHSPTASRKATWTLSWLDAHLAMMELAGQVTISKMDGNKLIALGAHCGELGRPPADLASKIKETIAAMDILKSDHAAQDFLHEVVDEKQLPAFA